MRPPQRKITLIKDYPETYQMIIPMTDHLSFKTVFQDLSLHTSMSPRAHLHVVGMLRIVSLTYTNRTCPLLLLCFLLSISLLRPFHLYFIPQILLTTLRILTLFSPSYFCLIGPFNYISLSNSLPKWMWNILQFV